MPEAERRPRTRQTRLTGRAALLAVVLCAIALSLAYPLREYLAQRQQIDQLIATRRSTSAQVKRLRAEERKLHDPSYIKALAEDQLHMCMPNEKCYVVLGGTAAGSGSRTPSPAASPWYAKLWQSVKQADSGSAR